MTVKPIFSEKSIREKLTTLIDDGKFITDSKTMANTCNDYFVNVTKSLEIPDIPAAHTCQNSTCDEIDEIIERFNSHPSILVMINQQYKPNKFDFQNIDTDIISKHITNLSTKKAKPELDIPTKILKEYEQLYSENLKNCFNSCNENCEFPDSLKMSDVSAAYKKK